MFVNDALKKNNKEWNEAMNYLAICPLTEEIKILTEINYLNREREILQKAKNGC